MFGLPENSHVGKQLPKTAIYAKFAMNSAEREKFDADISRMAIAHVIDTRHLAGGQEVKSIYVFTVQLKRKEYDPKNIVTLAKLIEQNIIFALMFENEVFQGVLCPPALPQPMCCLPALRRACLRWRWPPQLQRLCRWPQ